jgi:ribonuclease E
MRKGRSQRKTRGSLPPLSMRPRAALSDQGAGPQVVSGVTPTRSDEPAAGESLAETRGDDTRAAARSKAPPATLEVLPEPLLELVEPARLELVDGDSGDDAPSVSAEPARAEPEAPRSSREPERAASSTSRATSRASAPHASVLTTPGEMSIPPMGDLSVEPVAEQFFSEGDLSARTAVDDDEEWDALANKAVRKSLPEVVQRRARFSKYVRWAVGGAAIVCVAAFGRTLIAPVATSHATNALAAPARAREVSPSAKGATLAAAPVAMPAAATAATAEPATAAAAEPATAAAAEPATAAAAEPATAAAAEPATAAAAEPAPVAAEIAPAAVDAPKVDAPKAEAPADGKTALQEKVDARRALERGKTADAIAAGERSVALDATDGEAWLLLGAAYQEKGQMSEARRAYASCLKEGKRGPLGECRAMLR